MANIKVTPEVLSAQGQELKGYATDLQDILKLIDTKITEIDSSWDGLAQQGYTDLYKELKPNLDKFPQLVDDLGTATVGTAEKFAQLDQDLQTGFSGGH